MRQSDEPQISRLSAQASPDSPSSNLYLKSGLLGIPLWLNRWPFYLEPDAKGWITLGVFALIIAGGWWFLYKDWLHIYFQKPRRNKRISRPTDTTPTAPIRTENRLSAPTPSEDTLTRDKLREFMAALIIRALKMIKMSLFWFCSIANLLSKVRKHKSTVASRLHKRDHQ